MTAPARRISGLTPQQAEAATQSGAVLVLAGAGTGKTRTLTAAITDRIARRGIAAQRILAVTFTNKAAAEMRERVRAALDGAAPSWLGTFHGLAARQLREEPEIAGLRPGFDILDADDSRRLLKRTLKALNLADTDDGAGNGRDPLKLMSHRIARFKDDLIGPTEAPARAEAMIAEANRSRLPIDPTGWRSCAQIYGEYQRRLREANAADFGDLLLWPVRTMQADAGYRRRWASRFDSVLADEFQDVNLAQFAWLQLLAADHGEIFVVGDDDQSVYGWRGADVGYIRRFTRDFPGAAVFRLEENFRSTGHILGAANAVIAQDLERLGKTLFTRKPAGELLEILGFHDPEAEAAGLVAQIARRHAEGLAWDEVAILYRSNALSRGFEEALMRAHIPYALVGDVGFYQRAEIKDALALLRLAATPDDRQADEAFRRVINVPARGFGPKALAVLEAEAAWRSMSLLNATETAPLPPKARSAGLAFADAVRRVGRNSTATLADQLSLLIDTIGYRRMLRESRAEANEGRLENLQELVQLAGGFHTARELLDHAALATGGPDDDKTGRVQLMTLHKAKGLEFPQVFLPAWEDGVFPPDYGDPAEERRLAYVAITRGMRRVTISHCNYRRRPASPSPFIADIPGDHRAMPQLRDPHSRSVLGRQPRDRSDAAQLQRRF
jgi:DNA helicase II / ATP-dependent DNA helicase PcrA